MYLIKKYALLTSIFCVVTLTLSSCMSAGGVTGRVVPRNTHEFGINAGFTDVLASRAFYTSGYAPISGVYWRFGVYDAMDLSIEYQGNGFGLLYRYQFRGTNLETDKNALSLGGGPIWLIGGDDVSATIDVGMRLGLYMSTHPSQNFSLYSHPIMHVFFHARDSDRVSFMPLWANGVRFGTKAQAFFEVNLGAWLNSPSVLRSSAFAATYYVPPGENPFYYDIFYQVVLGGYLSLGGERKKPFESE